MSTLIMQSDSASSAEAVLATPLVRRRADALAIDLAAIPGSGVAGRVTLRDLLRAAGQTDEAATVDAGEPGTSTDGASAEVSSAPPAYVTPVVRRLAVSHGVDLAQVVGTGVGGRIRKQDVLAAAAASHQTTTSNGGKPSPAGQDARRGTVEPLTSSRADLESRASESLQGSAWRTAVVEVDLAAVTRLATEWALDAPQTGPLAVVPYIVRAVAQSLQANAVLNATVHAERGAIEFHAREDLAVELEGSAGVVVVEIPDASSTSVQAIARLMASADEDDREVSSETATFILTCGSGNDVLFDTPLLPIGRTGALNVGAVVKRPVVMSDPEMGLGDTIAVRSLVLLALTYDHRLVRSTDAARFLARVRQQVESGDFS
ncbi:2-oxo acid dehydrogenase subunit E2 [Rhodococcus koreensis]